MSATIKQLRERFYDGSISVKIVLSVPHDKPLEAQVYYVSAEDGTANAAASANTDANSAGGVLAQLRRDDNEVLWTVSGRGRLRNLVRVRGRSCQMVS